MRKHLTERAVKAAEPVPGRKTYIFDDECLGFALAVSGAGSKRFVLDYTIAHKQRRLLGHTQAQTTERYAHLLDSPLRDGVNAIGGMLRPHLRVVA